MARTIAGMKVGRSKNAGAVPSFRRAFETVVPLRQDVPAPRDILRWFAG